MINKLKIHSVFFRSVVTLMSGAIIAQAIPIAISPILTRLYTPEAFGLFATYLALVTIIGNFSTGRLDMAIILPKRDSHAFLLFQLGIFSSFIVSIIFLLLLVFAYFSIDSFNTKNPLDNLIYLAPCGVFFFATYSIFIAWLNRKERYKSMSSTRKIQATSISATQVVVGLFSKQGAGIIVGDITGRLYTIISLLKSSQIPQIKFSKLGQRHWAILKRYQFFPLKAMPASLLNILGFQLPFLVIPLYFSSAAAGMYFLVFRVMMLPISMIGNAILEVFKNRAIADVIQLGTCRSLFKKTALALFIISTIPLLVIIKFGPELFAFIFGDSWAVAGVYAQILSPMAFFRFISAPLSYVIILREKLQLNLVLQFIFFLSTVLSLSIGLYLNSLTVTIGLLSLAGTIFYLIQIYFSYKLS